MQISRISLLAQAAKLVPVVALVLLYIFVAGRLWAYVAGEFVKIQIGG